MTRLGIAIYFSCMNALRRASDIVGGVSKLAKGLSITAPTIYQWMKGKRPIPAERCPQIERLTGGLVRCEELRPDVEWSVLRNYPDHEDAA